MKRSNFLALLSAGIAAASVPLAHEVNTAALKLPDGTVCEWEFTQTPWEASKEGLFSSSNFIALCRTHGKLHGFNGAICQGQSKDVLEPSFYVPLTATYYDWAMNGGNADKLISDMVDMAQELIKERCKNGCHYAQALRSLNILPHDNSNAWDYEIS